MTQVEIFGFAPSTYTRTVLLVAREKGIEPVLHPLDFGAESHRAVHPFLKMPALRHGEVRLYESAAIAVYLDEAFPGPSLQPRTPAERALMWQWTSAAIDYVYRPLVADMLGPAGDAEPGPAEREARNRVLDVLAAGLARRPYLAGDAVSLADFVVAPMLGFHVAASKAGNPLAGRPALAAWLDGMTARESFRILEAA